MNVISELSISKTNHKAERARIVSFVKILHTKMTNNLKLEVEIKQVQNQWTRLLDLNLLINGEQLPDDSEDINKKFKEVIKGLEKRDMRPILHEQQQHTPRSAFKVESHHKTKPLSTEATSILKVKQTELRAYLRRIESKLVKGTKVDRNRMFAEMNGYLAISAMLNKIDSTQ